MQNLRAIYDVIRTRMDKTGQSACKVVLANRQFSGMTMKKVMNVSEKDLTLYRQTVILPSVCKGCTHFHADYVSPKWKKSMRLIVSTNGHKFYKEKV